MQKQLIGLILCMLAYCYAYEWEHVYTATGEYEHFNRLFFFSPDTGFAVGYGVTATTDGGKTWTRVTDDITLTRNITFIDRKHGFACGDGFIRSTKDGGNSWKFIFLADSVSDCYYKNILFLDSLTGFLARGYGNIYPYPMSYGRLLKTIDGGNTWNMVLNSSGDKINDIVVDPQSGHLYAVGGQNPPPSYNDTAKSWIAKSYDNGETWKIKRLNQIEGELRDIQFIDSNNLYASTTLYFCKLDSALNINYLYNEPGSGTISYSHINFLNKDIGFALGEDFGYTIPFYSTTDGGMIWKSEIEPDSNTTRFYDVCIIDTTIYAASSNKLYKTSTTTSINHFELNKTDNLLTCYPNPFNPTTNISYSLSKAGLINLSVYNAKGELVNRLFQGTQPAGEHRATFNATGLNSGVYFVKLSGEKMNVNKKVLLIK